MNKFEELGINESILKTLEGFEKPTEVQEKAIPLVLQGKDVIAGAATGSGKTLAFGSGIIQNSEKGKGIQSLILTPTRELAEQIARAIKQFSKFKPLTIAAVYGGVAINPQMDKLQIADVVVGTPGRILDHIGRNTINLGNVKILVLDEADQMLDMGFIDDVERIIKSCPTNRQTLMFSATIPTDIERLVHKYMKSPVKVSAVAYVDPKKLKQVYYDVQANMKFSLLAHLLKHEKGGLVMVFCNTRKTTDFVAKNLNKNDVDAHAIHGGLTQSRRNSILEKFHSKKVYVMVCTDVAARGLDIQGVSHIYNYDIPKESKQYIHRIGRTARAGKEGKAVNLISYNDHDNFSRVMRDCNVQIEKQDMPKVERAQVVVSQDRFGPRRQGSGGFGPRKSGEGGYGGGRSSGGRFGQRGHSSGGHSRFGQRGHSSGDRFGQSRSEGSGYSGSGGHSRFGQSRSEGSGRFGQRSSRGPSPRRSEGSSPRRFGKSHHRR